MLRLNSSLNTLQNFVKDLWSGFSSPVGFKSQGLSKFFLPSSLNDVLIASRTLNEKVIYQSPVTKRLLISQLGVLYEYILSFHLSLFVVNRKWGRNLRVVILTLFHSDTGYNCHQMRRSGSPWKFLFIYHHDLHSSN